MSDMGKIHCGDRQLLFTSAATAETTLPGLATAGDLPEIIGYDFEHWPQTPADEQRDPLVAVKRMRALADRYHVRLLFAPDRNYGQQLAGVGIAAYIDVWALQLQQFDGSDQTYTYADPIINAIRATNPTIRVSMQFSTGISAAQIADVVARFRREDRAPDVVSLLYGSDAEAVRELSEVMRK